MVKLWWKKGVSERSEEEVKGSKGCERLVGGNGIRENRRWKAMCKIWNRVRAD